MTDHFSQPENLRSSRGKLDDVSIISRVLNGEVVDKIIAASKMLASRPLVSREFDILRQAISSVDMSGRILTRVTNADKFGKARPIKTKQPFGYDGLFYETVGDRLRRPARIMLAMEPNALVFSARTYPVLWSTAHVQTQHTTRGEGLIDYGSMTYREFLSMAITINTIADNILMETGRQWMPIVIPEKDGIYPGYCEKAPIESLQGGRAITSSRDPSGRSSSSMNEELQTAQTRIVISTYINMKHASATHRKSYDFFAPIFEISTLSDMLNLNLTAYSFGNTAGHIALAHLADVFRTLIRREERHGMIQTTPGIHGQKPQSLFAKSASAIGRPTYEQLVESHHFLGHVLRSPEWQSHAENIREKVYRYSLPYTFG